jgi:hypothetical protein
MTTNEMKKERMREKINEYRSLVDRSERETKGG